MTLRFKQRIADYGLPHLGKQAVKFLNRRLSVKAVEHRLYYLMPFLKGETKNLNYKLKLLAAYVSFSNSHEQRRMVLRGAANTNLGGNWLRPATIVEGKGGPETGRWVLALCQEFRL